MIYDVIVVGTGAGGSTVARELSIKGLDVLILEKGEFIPSGSAVTGIKTADLILNQDEVKIPEYEFLKYPGELMYIEGVGDNSSFTGQCLLRLYHLLLQLSHRPVQDP